MRSYNTSRMFFGFLELVAWPTLSIGVVAIVYSARNLLGLGIYGFDVNRSLQLLIIGPAVVAVLYSLMIIIIAQVGRAGVDTAELTGQMLRVARDQLEVSQQLLRQGDTLRMSYAALVEKSSDDRPLADYGAAVASGRRGAGEGPPVANGAASSTSGETLIHIPVVDGSTRYQGREILHSGSAYLVEGERFATLDSAKGYVDELLKAKR